MRVLKTVLWLLAVSFGSGGQNLDEHTRQLFAEEFLNARPAEPAASHKDAGRARRVSALHPARLTTRDPAQLGMTLWLLRPARSTDGDVRMLVHENGQETEWVPERVAAGTVLREGNRVRLSFESARKGYLYVIDREVYSGSKQGNPYLIFPTTRLRGGENRVVPGRLIEIPAQEDRPDFLTVTKSRPDQLGDLLFVIVASQPLPDVPITSHSIRISSERLAEWQREWGAKTEMVDLKAEAGKTWTRAEQEAGASETRLLTQEDPGPQTIYRVSTPSDKPLLISFELHYSGQ